MGIVQSCTRGGLVWTLGSISSLRGWSNTGTDFLEMCWMPQACQCLRGIWTMPLIFWSALKWSSIWTRWSLQVQLKYSMLYLLSTPLFCVPLPQLFSHFHFLLVSASVCVAVWWIALRAGFRINLTSGGWKQDKLNRERLELVVTVQPCDCFVHRSV